MDAAGRRSCRWVTTASAAAYLRGRVKRRRWDKPSILKALRAARRQRGAAALSWRALATRNRPLVAAATYHFGSLASALTAAGIDAKATSRKPIWTKDRVIRAIKHARRKGRDLSWGATIARPGPLRRAAFAGKRLFGSWARALHVAGVDIDEWRRYYHWDRHTVAFDLRQRKANGDAMNSGAVQADEPALHAAAIRYFKTFDAALKAAKLDPARVRVRKKVRRR